jgi:hypothetical protein
MGEKNNYHALKAKICFPRFEICGLMPTYKNNIASQVESFLRAILA